MEDVTGDCARSLSLSTALQAMLWKDACLDNYALPHQRRSGCRHSQMLEADHKLDKISPGFVAGRLKWISHKQRMSAFWRSMEISDSRSFLLFKAGGRHSFAGNDFKQYADELRDEMDRRRLRFTPIDWPR